VEGAGRDAERGEERDELAGRGDAVHEDLEGRGGRDLSVQNSGHTARLRVCVRACGWVSGTAVQTAPRERRRQARAEGRPHGGRKGRRQPGGGLSGGRARVLRERTDAVLIPRRGRGDRRFVTGRNHRSKSPVEIAGRNKRSKSPPVEITGRNHRRSKSPPVEINSRNRRSKSPVEITGRRSINGQSSRVARVKSGRNGAVKYNNS
jgi:hypothetical protein